jgi:rhodanese-related sulfurtransferase
MMNKVSIINAKELHENLKSDNIILIDVREPAEYKDFHIDKSINIPMSVLLNEIDKIDLKTSKKIVMQCRVGIRSMNACRMLYSEGYDLDFLNLEGGIKSWIASGYEIKK